MDDSHKQALRDNEQKLPGVIVADILPDLKPYLTEVEFSLVDNKLENMAQVIELVRILQTKENRHFDGLCHALVCNGYLQWAHHLQAAAGGHVDTNGRCCVRCTSVFIAFYVILYIMELRVKMFVCYLLPCSCTKLPKIWLNCGAIR